VLADNGTFGSAVPLGAHSGGLTSGTCMAGVPGPYAARALLMMYQVAVISGLLVASIGIPLSAHVLPAAATARP
jgi:hypothetical protein